MCSTNSLSISRRGGPRSGPHRRQLPRAGWSLLCNGVIVFDDTGEILPDGTMIAPHRGPARHALAA